MEPQELLEHYVLTAEGAYFREAKQLYEQKLARVRPKAAAGIGYLLGVSRAQRDPASGAAVRTGDPARSQRRQAPISAHRS
jgi:hypothetical protein